MCISASEAFSGMRKSGVKTVLLKLFLCCLVEIIFVVFCIVFVVCRFFFDTRLSSLEGWTRCVVTDFNSLGVCLFLLGLELFCTFLPHQVISPADSEEIFLLE